MTASEQSTLVDEYPIESILNRISPWFDVQKTKYGGRGCFATGSIPKGSVIHRSSTPVGFTIAKPFKKEVCTTCFEYDYGSTMKSKISKKSGKNTCSIFFCSDECAEKFTQDDVNEVLLNNLIAVEKNYLQGLTKPEVELKEPKDLEKEYLEEWDKVSTWESKLDAMKPTKRQNMIPRIDDSEYLEIKYVIGVLFNMYKCHGARISNYDFPELKPDETNQVEMVLFDLLYSSEYEKVKKYPYLLYSYINIYKFIRLSCTPELQPFINLSTVRAIIGKNLSNAFGIWSEVSDPSEDKEFLGYAVYPSASYFNHSCAPNIIKSRKGHSLEFTTLRDIESGEELCINYGNYTNEPVEIRRAQLSEWFFDCGCSKCVQELNSIKQ
ncbi:putative protein lysine methyltransferase SET6 [Candida viswanathii]|uniref:SET domain-containing protein n=1 Tax=Candida viswanathii TaxID=5486 RepID=A0A367XPQ0_9ASCO|nr:putative protein lysine methyltransferase SET6 [Candida viswanathii]